MKGKLPPIHPGTVLSEEFLKPFGLSQNRIARDLGVPVSRIAGLVKGERGVTADTALRLSRYFGTTPAFWLNMQSLHDIAVLEDLGAAASANAVKPLQAA